MAIHSDAAIRAYTTSFIVQQIRFALWLIIVMGLVSRIAVPEFLPGSIISSAAVTVGGWTALLGVAGLLVFEFVYFVYKKLS